MGQLSQQPGLLFVVATLLPLASFLLLILAGAARAAIRPYKDKAGCQALYDLFGGDAPGKTPAYIATAAIGLAFLCSAVGFVKLKSDEHRLHHLTEDLERAEAKVHKLAHQNKGKEKSEPQKLAEQEAEKLKGEIGAIAARWQGRIEWARVGWYQSEASQPEDPHKAEAVPDSDRLNEIRRDADPRSGVSLQLGFKIDNLATIMFVMVTFIATLIHLYSIGYMADELQPMVEDHEVHGTDGHFKRRGRFGRFFMFLSLFSFSMLNLVLADNLFQIFLSWELVGICSYLLIGFYYERTSAANAANKAFITNRIGDAGFIIGLMIIWTYMGTFNFEEIFKQVRAPMNSHGAPDELSGRIVRAKPAPPGSDSLPRLEITGPGEGSEVVLFRRPPRTDHYHMLGIEDTVPINGSEQFYRDHKEEFDCGSMPYWLLVLAGIGVFTGCIGKSAQFPLQVWLPDAMEGPTPVSALIHAATMVAAGVYLVGRVYPLFPEEVRIVIAYVGAITLFVAATIALVQTDIKKVLAYSTVSQLGYMMLALGVGGWAAGLFHLLTHAFFKALLFLGSGAVIYGCHHVQDMGKMGGLFKKMPITAVTMLVGCLAIMGFPLTAGWYSKDGIIAHAMGFMAVHPEHALLFVLPLVTAGITTFYMFRMWFLTFTGEPRDPHVYEHASESPWTMTVPLVALAACSVGIGWGSPIWDAKSSALEHHVGHAQHISVAADFGPGHEYEPVLKQIDLSERHMAHELHDTAGLLALMAAGLGLAFACVVYYYRKLDPAEAQAQYPGVHRFLWHKWYFDEAYSALLVRPSLRVAGWFRWFDTYVIDGIIHFAAWFAVGVSRWDGKFDNGVVDGLANLVARVVHAVGGWFRTFQTGYIRSYVLFLVLAAVSLFVILAWIATRATAG